MAKDQVTDKLGAKEMILLESKFNIDCVDLEPTSSYSCNKRVLEL